MSSKGKNTNTSNISSGNVAGGDATSDDPKSSPNLEKKEIHEDHPNSLLFHDLTSDHLKHITYRFKTNNHKESVGYLAKVMNLPDYQSDALSSIVVAYYYDNLKFALSEGFNDQQTSIFFSIMKALLTTSLAAPKDEKVLDYNQSLEYFKDLLVQYTIKETPSSEEELTNRVVVEDDVETTILYRPLPKVFGLDDIKAIIQFASRGFFQHYTLYRCVYTTTQPQELSHISVLLQTACRPPLLSQAITEAEWMDIEDQKRLKELEAAEALQAETMKNNVTEELQSAIELQRQQLANALNENPEDDSAADGIQPVFEDKLTSPPPLPEESLPDDLESPGGVSESEYTLNPHSIIDATAHFAEKHVEKVRADLDEKLATHRELLLQKLRHVENKLKSRNRKN